MRTCEEILDLISLRLDGELTPEQEQALTEHLASCPACKALAADLSDIHSVMPGMNMEPPASIMENVMGRIRGEEASVIPFPVKKNSRPQWKAWAGVAAALVLVAGGAIALWGGNAPKDGAPMTLDAGVPEASTAPSAYKAAIEGAENGERAVSLPTPEPSAVPSCAPEAIEAPADEPTSQDSTYAGEDGTSAKSEQSNTTATAGTEPPQVRAFAMPPPQPSASAAPSAVPSPTPDNRQMMTGLAITSAAIPLTPAEAAKELYETVFAESYPDAEYMEKDGGIQYILEPMHPISEDDPDGQLVSFVLDYRYLSDNGKYYVFLVESVFIDSQEIGETRGSYMQFIAYPSGGEGEVLYEPSISDYSEGQYQISEDYETARTAFGDKVNK